MNEKWWKTRLIFFCCCAQFVCFIRFGRYLWMFTLFSNLIFFSFWLRELYYIWLTCYSFVPVLFSCLSRLVCWQMRSRVYQLPGGHASWNPHWGRIGWRPRSTSVAVWRLQSRCRVGQQDGEQRPTRVSLSACLKKLCFVVSQPYLYPSHPSIRNEKKERKNMEDVKEKSESFRYDRISSSSGGGMFFRRVGGF